VGGGKFREVSSQTGLRALPLRSARGGAYCDYDNDGDIDILISNIDDRPQLLENVGGDASNWLELRLAGVASNRDAIGARVKVVAGDLIQYDHVRAGGSFLSGNDLRLHFGLADAKAADSVEIQWPSGKVERIRGTRANQILTIREGSGIVPGVYRAVKR